MAPNYFYIIPSPILSEKGLWCRISTYHDPNFRLI